MDRIRGRVLGELDRWSVDLEKVLEGREPPEAIDAIARDVRDHLLAIAAATPDPGAFAPQMRAFTIGGAIYVAVYLALAPRGYDAARAWEVCDAATRSRFARMGGLEKKVASDGILSWPMKALSRWLAKRSQAAPVGGWVFRFVEGEPGGFEYGVDYERCAIRELAIAHGAEAFAPYICLADISGSEIFGWGLERNETLAQGGTRCDFRFHRGGETRVRVRLPVA